METGTAVRSTAGIPGAGEIRTPRGRIDQGLLDRLSVRVTAVGPKEALQVHAPFTGEVLGEVPHCTADDVREAIRRSRDAQGPWAGTGMSHRAKIVLRFHDRLLAKQDEILDLIQLETGKARRHAFEEVVDTAMVARYYGGTAEEHLRPRKRRGAVPGMTQTSEVFRPRGVVGIVAPWNYPLTLGITDAIPALLAGNGVVLKPDRQTPYSALWAAELLLEAGLPPGLLQVVTGPGRDLGPALVEGVDCVAFTGSTDTGRGVARLAGENLVPCSLELGGKNPMIVREDADLDKAVAGAAQGCFASAGQLCLSIERLYVHERIHDEFLRRFVERTRSLRLGVSLDWNLDVGSLSSARQLHKVEEHVEEAVAKGAVVKAGGRSRPDLGPWFYEPTILTNVRPDMAVHREETFGPVVAVHTFRDDDDAVALANDSRYGLSASIFTRDVERGRRMAERLQAGTVNVNETYAAAWASVDSPMGGFKQSGLGRRHGKEGIRKYTQSQTVAIQRGPLLAAPPGAVAGRRYAQVMTGLLRAWRRIPGLS